MARTTVYNNVFTEEKWLLVNEDNKDLMNEFVEYLHSVNRSQGTIDGYVADLKMLFIITHDIMKNKFFVDFNKRDIMKLQNYLINTMMLSPARVRRLRSTLSSLSNFIENILDDDFPNFRNIISKIEAPTLEAKREKTVFEDTDMEKLLDILVAKGKIQQACVLALAHASGARKQELLRFKIEHFTPDSLMFGCLYKTPEKIKTKGRGKQGKLVHRYVFKDKFDKYLQLWIEERERLGVDCPTMFVTKEKDKWYPMKVTQLDSYARTFSRLLGTDFYWHSLRHLWTTNLVKAGIPQNVIKDLQNWSSGNMVDIYSDIEVDDQLGEFFGEEGIKQVERKSLQDL